MRWIPPSIIVIAAIVAASVWITGVLQAPVDLTATALPTQEVVAVGDPHQHHGGASTYDLPEGVALHGISPIAASRTTRLDASLISTEPEPRSLSVDSKGGLWIAHSTGFLSYQPAVGRNQLLDVGGSPTAVVATTGRIWVADMLRDKVLVFDEATRQQVAAVEVPTGPVALAATNGRIWVASITDGLLTSIDISSLKASRPVGIGFGPIAIAVGDSELTIVNALDRAIVRVSITRDSFTVGTPIPVPAGPTDAVYASGSIWVSSSSAGKVVRIDLATSKVTKVIPVDPSPSPGLGPSALVLNRGVLHVINNRDRSVSTINVTDLSIGAGKTFGLVGNETPSALDAVMLGGDLLIADTAASVLARLDGDML